MAIKKKAATAEKQQVKGFDLESLDLSILSVNDLGKLQAKCKVELLGREATNEGFDFIYEPQNDFPLQRLNMTAKQLKYVKDLVQKTDSVIEGTDGCICAYFSNFDCQSMVEKLKEGKRIKIIVRGCTDKFLTDLTNLEN